MSVSSTYPIHRLSIFILQDGFSFLFTDALHSPLAFENFNLDGSHSTAKLLKLLKTQITSDFVDTKKVGTLEVIYANPQFSIVPQAYFEESHLPHYLKYSSKLIEGDDFSYDEILSIQANTVYIPYVNINNYLFDVFGSFKFTHVFTGLIEKAYKKSLSYKEYVRIHVSRHHIYFAAFRNQKMLLANAFAFETAEDFAYYVLFTINELNLNREEVSIEFTGAFKNTEENPALNILYTYLKHLSFSNADALPQFENQEGFQEHFNLL
ncbi:DUF3822 family protein [Psychroflexus sediminis]|uniref:DUF3822 domain-containing protein n=1 Tax=Psychroflexus sediminis TaxID=470826 RepID=A0A1G7Y904_9FLAO|nr:DUF3822 family protein [Psychroflexus sediminis]SDG92951.1 Protein of unknown function [Psychroflexus sediminis]